MALLAGLAARALPIFGVRVPLGPDGWSPRTFVNTRLSLPLGSKGGALRISVRASASARSALLVHLGGAPVGEVLIGPGAPEEQVLEVPAPESGRGLDIALALSPRASVAGEGLEPLVDLEHMEIAAPNGLALRPVGCLLVGAWPIAVLGLALMLRWAPARALVAVGLSAALAVLAAHVLPLQVVRLSPTLLAEVLGVAALLRLRLPGVGQEPPSGGGAQAWLWTAILASLPAVEISLLLACLFERTLLDHIPGFLNDAVDYWLEAGAFAHAGFRGGYFTIDERPAPASFSHFGSHGPLFPVVHGAVGRLMGWHAFSIPVLHLALLTAALVLLARRIPLDGIGRALVGLSLASFWPILLLLPTSLQEGLHLALAVILASMFRSILDGRAASRAVRIGLPAILVAATLIRPSWALLLPMAFALLPRANGARQRALAAAAGVALGAGLVLAFGFMAAPYGREEFFFMRVARLEQGASSLLARAAANAARFVQAGTAFQVRSRFLALGLALATGFLAARRRPFGELAFHAYNLGSILLATLVTYVFGLWEDYRLLSAHLLLTLLLLATSRAAVARRLAAFALLAQLGSAGPFIDAFRGLAQSYRYDPSRIEVFGAAARRSLVFDARQDPWCNTLVSVNPPYFYPEMVALPPGLGVTMLFGSGGAGVSPLRSRYVLLDLVGPRRGSLERPEVTRVADDHVRIKVGRRLTLDLRPLAATPVGRFYENLAARCRP